jgi:hypothetical protein
MVETFPFMEGPLTEALFKAEAAFNQPQSVSVRASKKLLLNLTDCRLLTELSEYYLRDSSNPDH